MVTLSRVLPLTQLVTKASPASLSLPRKNISIRRREGQIDPDEVMHLLLSHLLTSNVAPWRPAHDRVWAVFLGEDRQIPEKWFLWC